jgi:hypothetical protein
MAFLVIDNYLLMIFYPTSGESQVFTYLVLIKPFQLCLRGFLDDPSMSESTERSAGIYISFRSYKFTSTTATAPRSNLILL